MDKRYFIVFAVALLAAIGFFVYKDKKNEADLKAHEIQQYDRIIEVANSSSVAGLGQMGLALNKYKQAKGTYPDTLSALYPDYIPVKAFIDNIQWQYEPDDDDFYLAKTIRTREDKVVTAAIGSDLMPMETSRVASASMDEPEELPVESYDESTTEAPEVRITIASNTNPKPIKEVVAPEIYSINQRKFDSQSRDLPKSLKSPESALHGLEPVSTEKLNQEEQYVPRVQGNYLVWKNNDGSVGFGNVQYPSSEKMKIFDNEEWVKVRLRKVDAQIEREARKPPIIQRVQGNYLVWKHDDGSLGFGNVQYPSSEKMNIYDNEEWVQVRPREAVADIQLEREARKPPIIQRVQGNYLVWKNNDGSLGFGNVQYPSSEKMNVYDNEEWVQVHQQSAETQIKKAVWNPQKKKVDHFDRLIAARSDNFLVWKDSRGVICFGNVQYPIDQKIQIPVDGSWQPVKN
ncbi:MAG: hypothetical protein HKO68_07520 [Desulfobacterales bacterium]|nr:hypothetical protein [Desulfobacterales bacterium]